MADINHIIADIGEVIVGTGGRYGAKAVGLRVGHSKNLQ